MTQEVVIPVQKVSYCITCGNELTRPTRYCQKCGALLYRKEIGATMGIASYPTSYQYVQPFQATQVDKMLLFLKTNIGSVLLGIGAFFIAMGAILPWGSSIFGVTMNAFSHPPTGIATILAVLVLASLTAVSYVYKKKKGLFIASIVLCSLITAFFILVTIGSMAAANEYPITLGPGLFVVVMGGFCGLAGSIHGVIYSNRASC